MYRKRTNQLKRMKTTENIKLHIIHCKLVYLFALVWLLFHSTPLLHKSGKFNLLRVNDGTHHLYWYARYNPHTIQVWGLVSVYFSKGIPEPLFE